MSQSPPMHEFNLSSSGPNKVMFTDKITKAQSEMQKTNERLQKLEAQKVKMLSMSNQFMMRDHRANSKSPPPLNLVADGNGIAKDCTLSLRVLQVRFIPPEKYEKELLEKAYVRIMLDDDTYTSGFAKVLPHTDEDDVEEVSLNITSDSSGIGPKGEK